MTLRRFLTAVALVSCVITSAHAGQNVISGKLIDEKGLAIANALISIKSREQIFYDHEPVLPGQFSLDLKAEDGVLLTIEIKAKGFETRIINLRYDEGNIDIGKLTLKTDSRVEIGPMIYHRSTIDNSEKITFILLNVSASEPITIENITLKGSKWRNTECFDVATPGAIFNLEDNTGDLNRGNISVDLPKLNLSDRISYKGYVEVLQCEQKRLSISISYNLVLSASKSDQVRIEIPRAIYATAVASEFLNLNEWDHLVVAVRLRDGATIQTSELIDG